jgi:hypothetical protein
MARFYTVKAGNIKQGTTKSGNPFLRVGLVVKSGEEEGKWLNYFMAITDKTKERVKRDLATMGITNPEQDDFQQDGRLCCAVWDYDEYFKEDRVTRVIASKFPAKTKSAPAAVNEEEVPF